LRSASDDAAPDDGARRLSDELRGGVVVLRRWQLAHLDAVMDAVGQSQRELGEWLPWAVEMPTIGAERDFLAQAVVSFDAGIEFGYGVFEVATDDLVGGVGLVPRSTACWEIGYWTRSDRTGRGYATAAAARLTAAAFEQLAFVQRIEIRHDVANVASGAIPPKLGYRCEPEIDIRDILTPGHTGRGRIWAMSRSDFDARPTAP
jgi:ribosomal-protein-serine acetyltransferase